MEHLGPLCAIYVSSNLDFKAATDPELDGTFGSNWDRYALCRQLPGKHFLARSVFFTTTTTVTCILVTCKQVTCLQKLVNKLLVSFTCLHVTLH